MGGTRREANSRRNVLPFLCSEVWIYVPDLITCNHCTAQTPQFRQFSQHFHPSLSSAGQGGSQHSIQHSAARGTCVFQLKLALHIFTAGQCCKGLWQSWHVGAVGCTSAFFLSGKVGKAEKAGKALPFSWFLSGHPAVGPVACPLSHTRQLCPEPTIFPWFSLLLPYPVFSDSIQIHLVPSIRMALWKKNK